MKPLGLLTVGLTLSLPSLAQPAQATVVERGPHHRAVQTPRTERDERGELIVLTNSHVELATGLHYRDSATGQWQESSGAFEVTAEGHALARRGQHKVILAPNINSARSVDLLMPDGNRLVSNPMGLSFFDRASGKNVLIAEVKDCIGELVASNIVVYPDAFDTIKGAIRYTYTISSFEQDVILFEDPGSPSKYGLDPNSTTLEFYTEFHHAPAPREFRRTVSNKLDDISMDFGSMGIGLGKAFSLQRREVAAPVIKAWESLQGRQFLIEAVEFRTIQSVLQELSPPDDQAGTARPRRKSLVARMDRVLPAARSEKHSSHDDHAQPDNTKPRIKVADSNSVTRDYASVQDSRRALVLDYTAVNTSQIDWVFKGDETYTVTAPVNLGGTTTIEGGSVIKLAPGTRLTLQGALICRTDMYRPAAITSRNDNNIGQTVPNSTGTPTKGDYSVGLELLYGPSFNIENLRIAYADTAIRFLGYDSNSGQITVRNSQFVKCNVAFRGGSSANFSLRNILASDFTSLLDREAGYVTIDGQHITAHMGATLGTSLYSATFKNCLFTDISANTLNYTSVASVLISSAGVYQAVGAGFHYLAPSSSYRNCGTATGLEATLLDDLKLRTTYPPVVLADDFSVNTHLWPRVARDTDTPDLGYHYDPLDYCWSALRLIDATLTMSPGVAVGFYGAKGITLKLGARLIGEGVPFQMNRMVRYNTVQEQPTGHAWNPPTTGVVSLLDLSASESLLPEVSLRFTSLSTMADSYSRRYLLYNGADYLVSRLVVRDCKVQNLNLYSMPYSADSRPQTFAFTNNIFDRCRIELTSGYYGNTTPFQVDFWNNLFTRGEVYLKNDAHDSTNEEPVRTWYVKDNLFDRETLTASGYLGISHNGFYATTTVGSNSRTLSAVPDYLVRPLGAFYYPVTGGNLSQLINAGSRLASEAGLYHFTLRADGLKEGHDQDPWATPPIQPTVDIGFHYAAVNDQFRGSESFHGYTDRPITWKYQYSTTIEGTQFVDLPAFNGNAWYGIAGDYLCQVGRTGTGYVRGRFGSRSKASHPQE